MNTLEQQLEQLKEENERLKEDYKRTQSSFVAKYSLLELKRDELKDMVRELYKAWKAAVEFGIEAAIFTWTGMDEEMEAKAKEIIGGKDEG